MTVPCWSPLLKRTMTTATRAALVLHTADAWINLIAKFQPPRCYLATALRRMRKRRLCKRVVDRGSRADWRRGLEILARRPEDMLGTLTLVAKQCVLD